jgi:hypothetical protein
MVERTDAEVLAASLVEPRASWRSSIVISQQSPAISGGPAGVELRYAGRPRRASPSEGYSTLHAREQARLLDAAFSRAGHVRLAGCAEAAA